jgi:hypothetical protein
MILDRKRRNGPGVVSKIVPLEACEEIDCWWHPDEDGPAPVLDAKPSIAPSGVSPRVRSASAVSAKTVSGGAALPVAAPASSVTTPLATVIRSAPFRSRRPPPPRYHPGAVFDSVPVRRNTGQIFLGLVLGLVAIGLTAVGLTVNTRFAASFGQTAEAAALLAAVGLTIDCLAIVLPSAAAQLWRDRHAMSAAAAWAIWLIALGMTLLAAIGFAATNIGDGVAGRSKVAAEASALVADIDRLRSERAAITETRAASTIEAEIQRAQPAAAAVWKQTAGCSNVTMAASGSACAEVLKLRQALGVAQRRDALDTDLRNAETRLAPLPAITTGDPQATMAADLVAWISLGHVSLTPHDIHRMRITGLTIIPALAGIIFMFATTLLRIGRRREPIAG